MITGTNIQRELRQGNHAKEYLRTRAARRAAAALGGGGPLMVGNRDVTREVIAELNRRQQAKMGQVLRECASAGRLRERRHVEDREGGGYVDMQVHPVSYHYWGQRLGYECWDDAQFVREYKRDNPYSAVTSKSSKPRVGWTPGQTAAGDYLRRKGRIQLKP